MIIQPLSIRKTNFPNTSFHTKNNKTMGKTNVKVFFSKNLVAVVMVPFIIGGHYLWYKLQYMDNLVPAEDRKKLPLATLFNEET